MNGSTRNSRNSTNQSHNAGATMAWEKGLLEDALLQQSLALQEWSRRDVYMLAGAWKRVGSDALLLV